MINLFRDSQFRWTILGTIECLAGAFYFAWIYDLSKYPKPFYLPILSSACIMLFTGLLFKCYFMGSAAAHYVPGKYVVEEEPELIPFPRVEKKVKVKKRKRKNLVQSIGEL